MLENIVKAIQEGEIDSFEIFPLPMMFKDVVIFIKKGDKVWRRGLTKNELSVTVSPSLYIDDIIGCGLREITQENK